MVEPDRPSVQRQEERRTFSPDSDIRSGNAEGPDGNRPAPLVPWPSGDQVPAGSCTGGGGSSSSSPSSIGGLAGGMIGSSGYPVTETTIR